MMKSAQKAASLFFCFCLLTILLSGCDTGKTEKTSKKYSIYAMMKDGKEYIAQTDSITSGTLNPSQNAATVTPAPLYYDLIVRDGFYYHLDWKTRKLIKTQVVDGIFQEQASLPLKGIKNLENYSWISVDSLLIIGFDENMQQARFAKIHIGKMTASEGDLSIPAPFGAFNTMSVGFSKFSGDTLLIGYNYHTTNGLHGYTTGDTMYTEVLHYPDMKPLGRNKDTRSAYPGGVNTRQSQSFTDEKGDFYFIACPGIALGNNPAKPTAIFRINKGETATDPAYFFNISASAIGNHGYGFWYIGSGKAIVRTERKGLFKGMKDHYRVAQMDFFVVDLVTKSTTRLDLPLDKGTARQCVLVEDGLVYITVNSDAAGSDVWIYNPQTEALQKGLHFTGDVDYILRLERLN